MKYLSRMYGLDALRGVAMTLGIFLHGSIAYKQGYHYGEWVFDKQFTSYFFDWIYLWINSFRMQTFFLLAGFFAHILIAKRGLIDFTKNRLKRIGLVLLLSYFTILPLTLAPYLLIVEFTGSDKWQQLIDFYFRFYTFRAHSGVMHLWFLQHLLIFYWLFISTLYLINKWDIKLITWRNKMGFRPTVYNFLFISSVLLGIISQLFKTSLPSIWTGFIIPLPQLLYYLFFFVLGWMLEEKRGLFLSFSDSYKLFLIVGTMLNFLILYLVNSEIVELHSTYFLSGLKFLFSIQTMLLTVGFIGLFNGTVKKSKPFWSYIADSAYWVYLIHMPIVLTTQLLLLNSPVPGLLRFPVVILVAVVISFSSYHFFIRYTWVGTLLNGQRVKT
jgi:glucans biosynthesis protein C